MTRFAIVLVLGLAATFVACSSDDTASPASPEPDASSGTSSGTPTPEDAGTDAHHEDEPITLGAPITEGKAKEWTFVKFPDSTCANGTPTGIGVNLGTTKRLVVYMEGGGACWDENTCYSLKLASNIEDGFDETKFFAQAPSVPGSHFDRTNADNPFKDDNFVYIPYCTGDVHAGASEQTYGDKRTKHAGRKNVEAFLKRIVPTFPDASRVVLTGSSAGGFGAALNYWRYRQYFGQTRVDLVDDSGPPFPPSKILPFPLWLAAWDLQGALPAACTDCANGNIAALFPYYAKTFTDARLALLSYDQDEVISFFFQLKQSDFQATLADVTTNVFDQSSNGKVFEVAGTTHTMLGNLKTKSGSRTLGPWLGEMVNDAATWTSQKPVPAK